MTDYERINNEQQSIFTCTDGVSNWLLEVPGFQTGFIPGQADVAHTVGHVTVTGEALLYSPLRLLTAFYQLNRCKNNAKNTI